MMFLDMVQEPESLEAVEKEVTSKRASVRRHSVVVRTLLSNVSPPPSCEGL